MKWGVFNRDGAPVEVLGTITFGNKRSALFAAEHIERLTGVMLEVKVVPETHCRLCGAQLSPFKQWIRRRCFSCGEEQP